MATTPPTSVGLGLTNFSFNAFAGRRLAGAYLKKYSTVCERIF